MDTAEAPRNLTRADVRRCTELLTEITEKDLQIARDADTLTSRQARIIEAQRDLDREVENLGAQKIERGKLVERLLAAMRGEDE